MNSLPNTNGVTNLPVMQPPNPPAPDPDPTAGEIGSSPPAQNNSIGAISAEASEIPKPPSKAYEWVAPGIYRYLKAGTLYERPWVNGRRTLRSLDTTDLHAAQRELRRRRGLPLTVQPPDPPELDSEMAARGIPKPPAKRFEQVAPGMYRYSRTGTFYERPWINGRRTWRSLGTTDLQAAQRELRRRRGLPTESGCDSRPIMKAVLEFNLPEAKDRFDASAKGLEWKSVVAELDRQLDSWIKERQHFATPAKAFRILRRQLQQRLAEKGLKLD